VEISLTGFCRYSAGLDDYCWVVAIEQPQYGDKVRLRLDRYHMGTDPSENAYPIAHVGTDVEGQIARVQKLPVESLHPAAMPAPWLITCRGGIKSPGSCRSATFAHP
jgi:hypothetical protein